MFNQGKDQPKVSSKGKTRLFVNVIVFHKDAAAMTVWLLFWQVTVLLCILFCRIALCGVVLHSVLLYCVVWCCVAFCFYCIALCCAVLYCIMLCGIGLSYLMCHIVLRCVVYNVLCRCVSQYFHVLSPEGRPEISDVSPLSEISGLSVWYQVFVSPLLFFCLVLSLFLSYSFLLLAHSPDFFPPKHPFSEK